MSWSSVFCVALFTVLLFEMHDCSQHKYGCDFLDNYFTYNKRRIFSNQIEPIALNTTEEIRAIINRVKIHNSDVMSTYPLNNIANFLRFNGHYNMVRNTTPASTFQEIFDSFTVSYGEIESAYSLVAEVMSKIITDYNIVGRFPSIEDAIYFATADTINPPVDTASNASGFVTNFKHNHVAGIIQFTLWKHEQLNRGYIVIETGLGLQPFYIIKNEGDLNIRYNHFGEYYIRFALTGRNKQYLKATHRPHFAILYYLNRAFCPIMTQTAKNIVLPKNRRIIVRNEEGFTTGEILVAVNTTYFYMRMTPATEGAPLRGAPVDFDDLQIIQRGEYYNYDGQRMFVEFSEKIPHLSMMLYNFAYLNNNSDFKSMYIDYIDQNGYNPAFII